MPTPLYQPSADLAAYQLHYAWSAWPSGGKFTNREATLIEATRPAWQTDGLRVLEYRWTDELVQILFSACPEVAPVFIAARAKGRLDHAARQMQRPIDFSRAVALRSIGDNTRRDVEAYVERQVAKEQFADPRWQRTMEQFTLRNDEVDLAQPAAPKRGRYWYNLHLVLVVADRGRLGDVRQLTALRDATLRVAAKKGHLWSRLSVMPDHLHLALRPHIDQSPLEVAYCYQNNLAYLLGCRLWDAGFYAGTFGEYTTHAVRKKSDR